MKTIKTEKYKIAQGNDKKYHRDGEEGYYWCPSCKKEYHSEQNKWCRNCGTHLNWIRTIRGRPL